MDGVKEYIFPVYDVDADEFKEYIGFIRTKPELIRCKDCKWWREDSDHTCKHFYTSPRVANDFCSKAEPKVKK